MSISLDQLSQLLAEVGISSSQEKEILIEAKRFITPLEVKEESTFEELCTSYEEQLCEKEIENDEKWISGDQSCEEYHANKCCIEGWIEVSTSLNQFCFCFYFIDLHLQSLISHTFECIRFDFVKSYVNNLLLHLHVWFHW